MIITLAAIRIGESLLRSVLVRPNEDARLSGMNGSSIYFDLEGFLSGTWMECAGRRSGVASGRARLAALALCEHEPVRFW